MILPQQQRRPRNVVSRHKGMSLRCADMLDEGMTDKEAAQVLATEFPGKRATAAAVKAFRNGTYKQVSDERERNVQAARQVELMLDSARGSGALFAQAGIDALAKMLFDAIRSRPEDIDSVKIGKLLATFVKVENQSRARQMLEQRFQQAEQLKQKIGEAKTPDQLVAAVDEIMGLRKAEGT